jgi:hypothetical protein
MGTGRNATRRTIDEPAPTVHFGERLNKVEWVDDPDNDESPRPE